jgi:type VI secretion system secreted protein VgrG
MPQLTEFKCPLEAGKLLFYRMHGQEKISACFEYHVELLSTDGRIDYADLLGHPASVKSTVSGASGESKRIFNGYVTRFGLAGRRGRYFVYKATMRPWLWLLNKTVDCRIFENKSVPDIVNDVFSDHSAVSAMLPKLFSAYEIWPYCVQYRESDYDFVCRLLQQQGINFHFEHTEDLHTMILTDSEGSYDKIVGYEQIPYMLQTDTVREDRENIREWTDYKSYVSSKYVTTDYDFERPRVDLLNSRGLTVSGDNFHSHEVFDYPGGFTSKSQGEAFANKRLEEVQGDYKSFQGLSNARGLACGYQFKLVGHPNSEQNTNYIVTSTTIDITETDYEGLGSGAADVAPNQFVCSFEVCASTVSPSGEVPPLARPVMRGPQTATVVGLKGEMDDDIATDKYGRVHVKFHWERYADKRAVLRKGIERSTAFLRVATLWAGKNYGFIALPRNGQEVIVDFLEGDPDQPIITGRVYNAEQMPPWALPDNKTRSGVITRSLLGDSTTANELRFEDKGGEEQILLHAEKNLDVEVEKQETRKVGTNQYIKVADDSQSSVGKNRSASIGANDTTAVTGNRNTTVGGDQGNTVNGKGTMTIMGDYKAAALTMDIKAVTTYKLAAVSISSVATATYDIKSVSYKLSAPTIEVSGTVITQSATAAQKLVGGASVIVQSQAMITMEAPLITLKAGPCSIAMSPAGIVINGPMVTVSGSAMVSILGAIVKSNA